LTALLLVTAVLVSWEGIRERAPLYYSLLLVLEMGCLGVFTARDVILFYIFFEFTLIPLFFLIGIWGSEERRHAATKFFLYTLAGSLLTFLGLLTIVLWDYFHAGTGVLRFSIAALTASLQDRPIEPAAFQSVVFLALFAGFAVKVPLFPLHTWLPLAHVQAPTAGSVLLAGILLKIGTYGFVRFSLPMLPDAAAAAMPWVVWLAVAGILYGALVALAQTDIKRLIAYSSVSHLGFCMLGLFAFNPLGLQGGALQMINHGLSTGALFALVGMLYERHHTREIQQLSGLARQAPWLAFFFLLFTFSSIGLPGLNGFVGEFMVLLGVFQRAWTGMPESSALSVRVAAVLAVFGVVLGAWYMLWLVQRVFFGPLRQPQHGAGEAGAPLPDLSRREILALLPLAMLVVWIGIRPGTFLARMEPTLAPIAATLDRSLRVESGEVDPLVKGAHSWQREAFVRAR
jgi:NADH-quinone oxidoreductase subunit M